MTSRTLLQAAAIGLVLLIAGAIAVSCIPRRPTPAPPPQTTAPPPEPAPLEVPSRDLSGRERDPLRGITPGALEAETESGAEQEPEPEAAPPAREGG